MTPFHQALETSVLLAEKIASVRESNPFRAELQTRVLREKQAMADFATFGLFKRAALDPAAISALQRGLGWGVGLGLPALGVGHMLLNDAQHHSADVLRDARNQALLTAAGVGGMQALGEMLKKPPMPQHHNVNVSLPQEPPQMPQPQPPQTPQLDPEQKLAAAILVDDVLEAASNTLEDPAAKHAALVALIQHRCESTGLLRGLLP
jgi:hypothetical protein